MLLPLPLRSPAATTPLLTSPATAARLGRGVVGVGVGVANGGLRLMPEIHAAGCDDHQLLMQTMQQQQQQQIIPIIMETTTTAAPSSPAHYYASSSALLLSAEGGGSESWRQYVPLVVSVAVIIDILLGSPLANMALAPMKRASEKGATGTGGGGEDGERGGSLFSAAFGGGGVDDGGAGSSRGKERVDSLAIAQAALDKAEGTLELKRYLEENKSNEQKYEDVRKKIDRQMEELDG